MGHEPLLQNDSGTMRFDLREGKRVDSWYVTIAKGDISVSRASSDAAAVVRCDKALFDEMATGRRTRWPPSCAARSSRRATSGS